MADPPPATASPPQSPRTSLLGAFRSLFLLQLLSRLVTFSLNQLLLRLVEPRAFGTASVQFELLSGTLLVLAREAARAVVLRRAAGTAAEKGEGKVDHVAAIQTRNLHRLPFLLGLALSSILTPLYLHRSAPSITAQPHFHLSLGLHLLATLLELLSEGAYLRALQRGEVGARVRAEGAGVILRAVSTVGWLLGAGWVWGERERGRQALVAFGVGQVVWGLCLVVVYARSEGQRNSTAGQGSVWSPLPERPGGAPLIPRPELVLTATLTMHSLIKHALTEGDRIVVGWASSLEDQAGYAVASNYASLIARILFQPIEESTRLYFSRVLSRGAAAGPSASGRHMFTLLVRSAILFALLCAVFIPPVLPFLVPLALPARYLATSAPSILRAHLTLYTPLLALNGILEAVFAVAAPPSAVRRQGWTMVVCSMAFGLALLGLREVRGTALGRWIDRGSEVVLANVVQMLIRIGYAWSYDRKAFITAGSRGTISPNKMASPVYVLEVMPVRAIFPAAVSTFLVRRLASKLVAGRLADAIKMLAGGGVMAVGCLAVFALSEYADWQRLQAIAVDEDSKKDL